jgi:NAD(P) transhydrogenase subunit beta
MHEAARGHVPSWVLLAYLISGIASSWRCAACRARKAAAAATAAGMLGMAIAVVTTLCRRTSSRRSGKFGAAISCRRRNRTGHGREIQMTAMPQLVAAFHSLVGMAAVLVGAAAFLNPSPSESSTVGRDPRRQPDRNGPGVAIGAITFSAR